MLMKIASAAACSVLAVAACVAVHAVAVWRHEAARPQPEAVTAVHAFSPGNNGRAALTVATSYPPRVRNWESARRFVAIYDLTSAPPRMTSVVSLEFPWLAACAAAAPYGFIATQQGEVYSLNLHASQPALVKIGSIGHACPEVLACSDDGRLIVIASLSLQLWDRESGRLRWRREDLWVRQAVFVPRSHRLICGLANGKVIELDSASGTERQQFPAHTYQVRSLSVSPCGRLFASTDIIGECIASRLNGGEALWTGRYAHDAIAEFLADGDSLAIANAFKGCSVAKAAAVTGSTTAQSIALSHHVMQAKAVPDGTVFITSGQPFVTAWQPATGESYRFTVPVNHLHAAAPDGTGRAARP